LDYFTNPLLHLTCRLIREGNAEDIGRGDSPLNQISNPISDHSRLARPGPRQDQYRPVDGLHGLPLLGIESVQIQHRARSLVTASPGSSSMGEITSEFGNLKSETNPKSKSIEF
jgi:hypothetical protein